MLRRFQPEPAPSGWIHPSLRFHRAWYRRRTWQWRARVALIALVVCVVGALLGLPKWVLALSVLAAFLPVPLKRQSSLSEIESRYGAAYTTALVAPEDPHGFRERLQRQAENVVFKAELPPLPWLELGIAVAFAALPFVLALSPANPVTDARAVAPDALRPPEQTAAPRGNAPVALDGTQAPNAPRGDASSTPGRAAGSGTLTERQVGQVATGGGKAAEAPEQLDREFLDALERGAIRTTEGSSPSRTGKIENRDRSGSSTDPNGQPKNSSGQPDGSQNAQGNQNGQRQSGQQGNQNRGNRDGQPSQGSGKNAQGNQPGNSAQNGSNGDSKDPSKQFNRGADRGQDGQNPGQDNPFDPNNPNRDANSAPGQPGRGSRNGGAGTDPAQAVAARGKLTYLPGQARGDQRRSGALQLPGNAGRGLSATPGSPEYRRAVESAILDPRLPPEYKEMLKNYYR